MTIISGQEKETAFLTEAEQKLLFYETILNRLDVGIHIVDKDGYTVVYNSTMAKLECEEASTILGKKLADVLPYLQPDNSTLLTVLKTEQAIKDRQQTYINAHGKQIITVNSTTPLYIDDQFIGALEIAKDVTYIQALSEQIVDLRRDLQNTRQSVKEKKREYGTRYMFKDIIGVSKALQAAIDHARRAAKTPSNVLIYGETGTGKELFAQSIHNDTSRKGDFVAINCAALPEQLLEGLLFGTVKGGFTGAVDRPGLFEQAKDGTILLDEINSMQPSLQAKLLRVIQERCVRRVGGSKEIPVDVRVIATMNVDPMQAISARLLREDLYYRLGVVTVSIPPLRERNEDVPFYIEHFIRKINNKLGLQVQGITTEVKKGFMEYPWPGNVRELAHAVEGAMNFIGDEFIISKHHLPAIIQSNIFKEVFQPATLQVTEQQAVPRADLREERNALERDRIIEALKLSEGNITQAAKSLGLKRQALQYKMRKFELSK